MMAAAAAAQPSSARCRRQIRQAGGDALIGQGLADDAGGGEKDLLPGAAQRRGGGRDAAAHRGLPQPAGEGIGIAGIDQDRPRPAALQRLAAPVDGGRGR